MIKTSDKITAIAVLDREQAMVVGYTDGKIELKDLLLNKIHDINTLYKIPKQSVITTISARASQQKTLREKAYHTIVVIGDASGNLHRFSIKRSTQVNGGLKANPTGKHTSKGSPIHSSAILSEEDFALGYTTGIQICTCKIGAKCKPLTFIQSPTPVALLPVTNNADFVAVFNDGSTSAFSAEKKSKQAPNQIQIQASNITAVDGIITGQNLGGYLYTLAVLDQLGNLTLHTNNQDIKQLGTVEPSSILAFDDAGLAVHVAKDDIKIITLSGVATSNPPPPPDLISFDDAAAPAALTVLPTVAAPNNPYTTMPNPSEPLAHRSNTTPNPISQRLLVQEHRQHASTTPGSSSVVQNYQDTGTTHYQSIPGSPIQQQRIPRIITSTTGNKFLMFSKASIAQTGASGAKLVLCRRMSNNKLVVVKKFHSQSAFANEMGFSNNVLETTRGAIRSYGWAEVKGRKNEVETSQTKYYIFIERMAQGDGLQLRNFLQQQNMDIIAKCKVLLPFANDLIQGLIHTFHQNNKYHLDIKPENFMLKYKTDNDAESYTLQDLQAQKLEAKLVDFGESIHAPNGEISTGKSDSRYMSPQKLALYRILKYQGSQTQEGDGSRQYYLGKAEDAWALGVTLLELLLKFNPFVDNVYQGREIVAGMNQQILTTCNHAFFNNKIAALNEQYKWFQNPGTIFPHEYQDFVRLIKDLVNIDENVRMTALQQYYQPNLTTQVADHYTGMPAIPQSSSQSSIVNPSPTNTGFNPFANDENSGSDEDGLF